MKVKELAAKLGEVDPELEIVCYSEDEDLLLPDHLFRLLTIESVDVLEAEQVRDDERVPTVKLGRSQESQPMAFLNVTGQF